MKNAEEKISFLIENLFLATNAVGVALYGHNSNVVAQIGTLDMDLVGKNLKFLFPVIDDLSCVKNVDAYILNVIKKNNINIVCSRLNNLFSLVCVFSKNFDINKNIIDVENKILELKKFLDELNKDLNNVIY